ncbi:hypothetical protein [Thermosynechococcus sp. OHK43]|uniref:hypothetical protein n=1 Tax=Thermosynechococcus sp. OHK43 TaxID=2763133 RepID=UPI0025CE624E|nr:hypothetical protein [Thermosynechococcus sp. OHK43]
MSESIRAENVSVIYRPRGSRRLLRQYLQFHLEQPLRVPPLLDSCFSPVGVSQP